jgi:4-amino-4-deoxychorismate lyase
MKLWWNGRMAYESEAVIPITDHGFLYGMGLFETFRTYGGKPFGLKLHIERMQEGCRELRVHYAPEERQVREAVQALLEANGLEEAYIRWSVSAGAAPLGLPGPGGYSAPNVFLLAKPLPKGTSAPKELHLLSLPRSTPEGPLRRKSFHYMNNILGKWELAQRTATAAAEGVFVDSAGDVVEGIVSNVFLVKDGVLFTPSLDTGCLPGVTRGIVLELAERLGTECREGRYAWDILKEADELFVTNSVQELTPVRQLFDAGGAPQQQWADVPGPLTRALTTAYRALTVEAGVR